MKNNIKTLKIVAFAFCLVLGLGSCTDDSYLKDGGKSNANFDGTVWEYLNSRPDYFKKLVKIIELADMEDVFKNDNITFFAPPDWSIDKSFNYLNNLWYYQGNDSIVDYSQIDSEVWKDFLSLYIVQDKYLLKDIPQIDTVAMDTYGGQAYVSYGGRPMNIGVVYADAGGVQYAGYRQLLYSYVNDFTENDMINAYIATSDIQPRNGVVHVIRFNSHYFGFNQRDFYSKAVAAGIGEAPQRRRIKN